MGFLKSGFFAPLAGAEEGWAGRRGEADWDITEWSVPQVRQEHWPRLVQDGVQRTGHGDRSSCRLVRTAGWSVTFTL